MVKKLGQRRFLLQSGHTEEELDKMSPSTAHSLIRDMEETNRKRREKEACISQQKDFNEIIEEIAELLKHIYNSNTCWYDRSWYTMAEIVYEKLLPEGSVVLSKKEAERFRGQTVNIAKVKAQACKETAEKIFDSIFKLETYDDGWNEMYYKDHIEKLAKQFSTKVEE